MDCLPTYKVIVTIRLQNRLGFSRRQLVAVKVDENKGVDAKAQQTYFLSQYRHYSL